MAAVLELYFTDIGFDHFGHEVIEADGVLPAELLSRLARISDEQVDFGWPEITRVNAHQYEAGLGIDALLVDAFTPPVEPSTHDCERPLDELAYGIRFAGGQDVVIRFGLLHHQPHAFDIVAGMAPVPLGVNVANIECVVHALLDRGHCPCHLASHEGFTSDGTFVIEQDAIRGVHAVSLAIIDRDPVRVELGHAVWTPWIERRCLLLRHLLDLAEQFRGRRLIEADRPLEPQNADRFKRAQGP